MRCQVFATACRPICGRIDGRTNFNPDRRRNPNISEVWDPQPRLICEVRRDKRGKGRYSAFCFRVSVECRIVSNRLSTPVFSNTQSPQHRLARCVVVSDVCSLNRRCLSAHATVIEATGINEECRTIFEVNLSFQRKLDNGSFHSVASNNRSLAHSARTEERNDVVRTELPVWIQTRCGEGNGFTIGRCRSKIPSERFDE